MTHTLRCIAACAAVFLLSPVRPAAGQTCPAPFAADYNVLFAASWSAETLPQQFPPNPHFSGLVGGVHNALVGFWSPGELASSGIEQMAETGLKSLTIGHVNAAIADGTALAVLSGSGIGNSPGSVDLDFSLNQDYPLVTLVSMIAPSPDWFVGVSALELFVDGAWVDVLAVPLFGYDAGTDSGSTYTSPNADTQPPEPITALAGAMFEVGGALVPFGQFVFTRQGADCVDADGDGIDDAADNCLDLANPAQIDADGDGHGNACDADLNNDCTVNTIDLGLMRSAFFGSDPVADFNSDGVVNVIDLAAMRLGYFRAPGPSAAGLCSP